MGMRRPQSRSTLASIIACLTLGVGIAASTVTLAIVDSTILHPLPYPQAERIFEVSRTDPESGRKLPFSYSFFYRAAEGLPTIEALAALSSTNGILKIHQVPRVATVVATSSSLQEVLRTAPILGRYFEPSEELEAAPVAVISNNLWQQQYSGDEEVLGQTLELNGETFEIIGVMPRGVRMPQLAEAPSIWIPLGADPVLGLLKKMFGSAWDRSAYLSLWARVPDRGSSHSAEQELRNTANQLLPSTEVGASTDNVLRLAGLSDTIRTRYRDQTHVLILAAALALLACCANVAHIVAARESDRQTALAIKRALGASSMRLFLQAFAATSILVLAGTGLGAALTPVALHAVETHLPDGALPWKDLTLRPGILLLAIGLCLVCGIVLATVAAFRAGRTGLGPRALQNSRASTTDSKGMRLRQILLVSEISCAALALFLTGLFVRTYSRIAATPLGFQPAGVVTLDLTLSRGVQATEWKRIADPIRSELEGEASTRSTAVALASPVRRSLHASYKLAGTGADAQPRIAEVRPVGPAYFDTLSIPLLSGRALEETDGGEAPKVCAVNETFRRTERDQPDLLGQRLQIPGLSPCQIVGVVSDTANPSFTEPTEPTVFLPLEQIPPHLVQGSLTVLVRLKSSSSSAARDFLRHARQVALKRAPESPAEVRTLQSTVSDILAPERFRAGLLLVLSALSVGIVAAGVYGSAAYLIATRRRELALRMALGTSPTRIVRGLLGQTLLLTGLGCLIGFALAYRSTSLIGELVLGMSLPTPLQGAAAILLLAAIVGVAVALPSLQLFRESLDRVLKEN